MELERDVEKYLKAGVRARGGDSYKFTSPARKGVPDQVVVMPGGDITFVEVKRDNGRLSALQQKEIDNLRNLGAEAITLYGKSDVDAFLRLYE